MDLPFSSQYVEVFAAKSEIRCGLACSNSQPGRGRASMISSVPCDLEWRQQVLRLAKNDNSRNGGRAAARLKPRYYDEFRARLSRALIRSLHDLVFDHWHLITSYLFRSHPESRR